MPVRIDECAFLVTGACRDVKAIQRGCEKKATATLAMRTAMADRFHVPRTGAQATVPNTVPTPHMGALLVVASGSV